MAEATQLDPQAPWPGLASFAEHDHGYFRGREQESDELLRLVRRERLTVLFGRSGLGKSSLLNAGLFPRLRDDLMVPVALRIAWGIPAPPRQQVWNALAAACAQAGVQAPPPAADESLWAYFHRAGAGFWNARRRPVLPVLVFDQFEEVFTLGQAGEGAGPGVEAFLDELADLVEDRPSQALREQLDADPTRAAELDFERRSCKVLLSFREDFLAMFEGLRTRMPSIMRNRYRLLPMSAGQARAVVRCGGALVASDVAERIIGLAWRNRAQAPSADEADRIEIDPALLSVICSELNLRRRAAGLDTIGAALLLDAEREILSEFYERSLRGQGSAVRQFIEDELITATGYRDSYAYDDALARPGVRRDALDSLVASRLLRVDERFGARRLELTHDVLTRVVMDSRDRRRERDAELALAQRERAAAATQRRNRRNGALVLAGVLAMFVAAGVAAWQTMQAQEARALAERGALEASDQQRRAQGALALAAEEQARAATQTEAARVASETAEIERSRSLQLKRQAEDLALKAGQLQVEAQATHLLADADRLPDAQYDTALLLNVEALHRASTPAVRGGLVQRLSNPGWPVAYVQGPRLGSTLMTLSHDGSRLASADAAADRLRVWQTSTGRHLADVEVKSVASIAFSPDGRQIALGTEGPLIVLDAARLVRLATLEGSDAKQPIGNVAFSPDGRVLAAAAFNTVFLWDASTFQRLGRLRAPGGAITGLAFSADGRRIAAATTAAGVVVWTLGQGDQEPVVFKDSAPAYCVAFSPNGRQLVSMSSRKGLQLWNADGTEGLRVRDEAEVQWCRVRFRADGARVVFVSDSRLGLWIPGGLPGAAVVALMGGSAPTGAAIDATGSHGAASDFHGRIALWQPDDPPARTALAASHNPRLSPTATLAFSPDGRQLATSGVDGISLWGLPGLAMLDRLKGHDDWTLSIAFSPDARRLAVSGGNTVTVWPLGTTQAPAPILRLSSGKLIGQALFDPDGQLLVVEDSKTIVTPEGRGFRLLATPIPGNALGETLALEPSGRLLALTTIDGLALWDRPRRSRVAGPPETAVSAVTFGAEGVLAYAGEKGMNVEHKLHLWDLARSRPLVELEGHSDRIRSLDSDRSGRLLVSSSDDGTIRLWDLARRESIAVIRSGADRFSGPVALSRDASRLATRADSGAAYVFDLDARRLAERACQVANRNLSCTEWRRYIGAGAPYRATCPAAAVPAGACR
ncbi:MAG: hypothetical protein JNL87_12035 [Burkholderiaceae bacterium]|nr:hypothetical protein [Burkholderiaceae bacterium]